MSFDPASPVLGIFTSAKPVPPSVTTSLNIKNTGDGPVTIGTVRSGDSHFTVTANCHGKRLAPDQSCTVVVTFAATVDNTYPAKLTVTDDSGGAHEIRVSGYRGPPIKIRPPFIVATGAAVKAS